MRAITAFIFVAFFRSKTYTFSFHVILEILLVGKGNFTFRTNIKFS